MGERRAGRSNQLGTGLVEFLPGEAGKATKGTGNSGERQAWGRGEAGTDDNYHFSVKATWRQRVAKAQENRCHG